MNQILMTEDKRKSKKNRSTGPLEVRSIVMFFSIAIIVFGVFLIGQGSFAIHRESKGRNREDLPNLSTERIGDKIIVKVNSRNKIEKLKYSWNNSEETVVPISDIYASEEITLPNENSILKIVLEDVTGRATKYIKECKIEGLDMVKPVVKVDNLNDNQGGIKIVATDETEIAYITYKIDDGEEIRINRNENDLKNITYVVKIEAGQENLTVKAVDVSGNVETIKQIMDANEVPELHMVQLGGVLTVTTKDRDGIKDVTINFNGQEYTSKDINQNELVVPIQLISGVNIVQVKVVNIHNLEKQEAREFYFQPELEQLQ